MTPGTLYIVGTPIGNLKDITLRALDTLKEVDIIAAEDTRQTRKLLSHYGIATSLTSYHAHNALEKAPLLLAKIAEGLSVALVSDAGTPGISDPGAILVGQCLSAGVRVVPIPGPSAVIAALPVSGLPCDRFVFEGFLPSRAAERKKRLETLRHEEKTLVFYEAPHRLVKVLKDMQEVLGDRKAALCRELTKLYEEIITESLSAMVVRLEGKSIKGEITLVVAGASPKTSRAEKMSQAGQLDEKFLEEALQLKMTEGLDKKDAIKAVAKETGASRNAVYAAALRLAR